MHKIVLIENRKDRLERLLEGHSASRDLINKLFNFDNLEIIDREGKFNSDPVQWDKYFLKFDQENLNEFMQYDILFIHKSKISREGHKNLDQFCRKNGKSIVYFSGGLTGITFVNDGYLCLSMNSSIFYSFRLIDFLEANNKNQPNIMEIAYGQKWQLSNLLKLKYLIHQLIFSSELNIELKTEIEDLIPIIEDSLQVQLPADFETENDINNLMIFLDDLIRQKMISA
jgi:hypothetical protein